MNSLGVLPWGTFHNTAQEVESEERAVLFCFVLFWQVIGSYTFHEHIASYTGGGSALVSVALEQCPLFPHFTF